mmetsp:Transcript_7520/g.17032  ORF Transcript_7520/g.17032 Transcript_7520/m.17032 type:complete len:285 (+) Transcript_7520:268-1122(+)
MNGQVAVPLLEVGNCEVRCGKRSCRDLLLLRVSVDAEVKQQREASLDELFFRCAILFKVRVGEHDRVRRLRIRRDELALENHATLRSHVLLHAQLEGDGRVLDDHRRLVKPSSLLLHRILHRASLFVAQMRVSNVNEPVLDELFIVREFLLNATPAQVLENRPPSLRCCHLVAAVDWFGPDVRARRCKSWWNVAVVFVEPLLAYLHHELLVDVRQVNVLERERVKRHANEQRPEAVPEVFGESDELQVLELVVDGKYVRAASLRNVGEDAPPAVDKGHGGQAAE